MNYSEYTPIIPHEHKYLIPEKRDQTDLLCCVLNDLTNIAIHKVIQIIRKVRGEETTWWRDKVKKKAICFFKHLAKRKYDTGYEYQIGWMIRHVSPGKTLVAFVCDNASADKMGEAKAGKSDAENKSWIVIE